MTSKIEIQGASPAQIIVVDGKITDIGIKVTDHYRIYKRADPSAMKLADKLGDMIGRHCFQVADHAKGRTTEAELIAAIAAAL